MTADKISGGVQGRGLILIAILSHFVISKHGDAPPPNLAPHPEPIPSAMHQNYIVRDANVICLQVANTERYYSNISSCLISISQFYNTPTAVSLSKKQYQYMSMHTDDYSSNTQLAGYS
jgi:hypothetical protein